MKLLLIVLACIVSAGCASVGKGTASCTFKPGVKSVYGSSWREDPEARCNFTLEVPLKNSTQAKDLAASFAVMLNASPTPEGVNPMKVDLKIVDPDKK